MASQTPFLSLISASRSSNTALMDKDSGALTRNGSASLRANGKCPGSRRLDRQPWKQYVVGLARGIARRKSLMNSKCRWQEKMC